MMSNITVGLSGAPGAGKSALAYMVKNELKESDIVLEVVDDYAARLEWNLGLAVGLQASYYTQMMIWAERFMRSYGEKSTIICGTDLDGLAYTSLLFEAQNKQIQTPMTQEIGARYATMLGISMFMFTDQPRPDLNYILPVISNDKLGAVDQKIRSINIDLQLHYPVLNGTMDENAARITKDINDRINKSAD